MTHLIRATIGAVAGASVLAGGPAHAQVSCDTLPNPIVVTGSSAFEPTLKQFAVKLAAASPPATVISVAVSSESTSCAGVASVVSGKDFGGLPGRYYTGSGTAISNASCIFPAGQTAHVAISDAFYESCTNVPQPRPADVADVQGPAQAVVFIAPTSNLTTVRYLNYEEARTLYGCGVSSTRMVAGTFSNPMGVFCLGPTSGTQIVLARNLGLMESVLTTPNCVRKANDAKMVVDLIPRPTPPCDPTASVCGPPQASIGFTSAGEIDGNRAAINPLAFQTLGQTQAFYPDSGPNIADRKNVRDGHYPLWGYVHLIARTTGGTINPQASELAGWITGTKTSANIDFVALQAGVGLIPQCAMKVKRSSDGGVLSPYSPPQTCHCGFEAVITRAIPPGCIPCASTSACADGKSCRHGFCE